MRESEGLSWHWNIWQRRAASQPVDGTRPVTILGGPGTGKSEALLARIAYLLLINVDPLDITYMAFHPRTAAEFDRRLNHLPAWPPDDHAEGARKVAVWTPEQWCADFLRLNNDAIPEIPAGFVVWGRAKAAAVMTEVGPQGNFGNPLDEETVTEILDWNDRNLALGGGLRVRGAEDSWLGIINQYNATKKETAALDLAELVPTTIRVMERNPGWEWIWPGNRPQHLLADGVQDASFAQRKLLDHLSDGTRSLTVTWDPNQAISSITAGDSPDPWPSREAWRPEAVHQLQPNLRAGKALADAARRLAKSPSTPGLSDPEYFASRIHREQPAVIKRFHDEDATREFLVDQIYQLHRRGRRWGEVAIICRDPADVRRAQSWLETAGIPCQGWADVPHPPDPGPRRVTRLLTSVLRPTDVAAFLDAGFDEEARRSVPVRHLEQSLDRTVRDQRGDVYEAVQQQIENFGPGGVVHSGLAFMIEAKREINSLLASRQSTLGEVCRKSLELLGLAHDDDGNCPGISSLLRLSETLTGNPGETLSSLTQRFLDRTHASLYPCFASAADVVTVTPVLETPGLEWPTVFVLDGDVPQEGRTQQEEQRLRFTAFTRGCDEVYYLVPVHRARRIWPDPWRVAGLLEHPDVELDTAGPVQVQEGATKPTPAQPTPQPSATEATEADSAESEPILPLTERAGNYRALVGFIFRYRNPRHPDPIDPERLEQFTDKWFIEERARKRKAMPPMLAIGLFLLVAAAAAGATTTVCQPVI